MTLPISKGEFYQLLQRCIPPGGWPNKIAVANSGGPDSTCLLFLLRSVIQEHRSTRGFINDLLSIHVDHDLQDSAKTMAARAAQNAHSLGVEHVTTQIPWSTPPFPPRPTHGQALELLARDARRNRLFHAMLRNNVHAVAFGQHADDQVETVLMRLAAGTSLAGAAGMRPVRRWGMGDCERDGMTNFGVAGMDQWIVRPLLSVSKDRILATCEANSLDYVLDPTNFQPDITLRNALRSIITQKGKESPVHTYPPAFAPQLAKIDSIIPILLPQEESANYPRLLREAINRFSRRFEEIETQASIAIERCRLPSPISTILLSAVKLRAVTDNDVRTTIIRRILRYVSPRPWGSVLAEARGDRSKLQRIAERLWGPTAESRGSSIGVSSVLWVPLALRSDGSLKTRTNAEEEAVWFVRRQPPPRHIIASSSNPLSIDITDHLTGGEADFDVVYDNRFKLSFFIDKFPPALARRISESLGSAAILIKPRNSWYIPVVVLRQLGQDDEVLVHFDDHTEQRETALNVQAQIRGRTAWVRFQSIRTLDAI